MKGLTTFQWFVVVFVVIGGINWGLIGFFHYDLIATVFGTMSVVTRIIYGLIGVCSLYLGYHYFGGKK